MKNVIWKLFSQTGNIETYLLLKELEKDSSHEDVQYTNKNEDSIGLETEM